MYEMDIFEMWIPYLKDELSWFTIGPGHDNDRYAIVIWQGPHTHWEYIWP